MSVWTLAKLKKNKLKKNKLTNLSELNMTPLHVVMAPTFRRVVPL
jgi:hypothetical protein